MQSDILVRICMVHAHVCNLRSLLCNYTVGYQDQFGGGKELHP